MQKIGSHIYLVPKLRLGRWRSRCTAPSFAFPIPKGSLRDETLGTRERTRKRAELIRQDSLAETAEIPYLYIRTKTDLTISVQDAVISDRT